MTKATYRYDEGFTIPAGATLEKVKELFSKTLDDLASDGADIDWANLEVHSERNEVYDGTFMNIHQNFEYTDVRFTVRGRR